MIAENMKEEVQKNSTVRQMFEEGRRRAKLYGEDKVFDFSLGNPSVPAPEEINREIIRLVQESDSLKLHGYMSNAGYEDVRKQVADSLNRRFDTHFTENNIIMTTGAAGAINIIFKTLLNPEEEVIIFAPYFMEYRAYVKNHKAVPVIVPPDTETFQPNLEAFEKAITPRTKALLLNSPNNPTGVVYSEETIIKIAGILKQKQEEFGTEIYIVSDEPYRELVYDDVKVPFVTRYYDNTAVCYSFSKSLSLPGERIGYLVIPNEFCDYEQVFAAASIAIRIMGYMNAPSLMQKVIGNCIDLETDIEVYDRNRKILYNGLKELGFECVKPEGAFYLFMKSPMESDFEFAEKAKEHNILIVPGTSFTCPGYLRISYCVSEATIRNSLIEFKKLAQELNLI
ncbi:pyridoxal phosphate-dependent aminotransferase [Parasporobacterium paucivorans]|uniref:Aminotransferase n=1 Tax=Parasporobacterium paucivorans DSM 15970 TaxID=1122934 RepID=A0A1M6LBJ2_9FIRM|nr:pyridoxal phosphate-dependent aminotransferase [Parasporobacterium paucivorans]SHJ68581.1 aspartate aminotransferase [Parasporobacterium paucivorans DSM 15970]